MPDRDDLWPIGGPRWPASRTRQNRVYHQAGRAGPSSLSVHDDGTLGDQGRLRCLPLHLLHLPTVYSTYKTESVFSVWSRQASKHALDCPPACACRHRSRVSSFRVSGQHYRLGAKSLSRRSLRQSDLTRALKHPRHYLHVSFGLSGSSTEVAPTEVAPYVSTGPRKIFTRPEWGSTCKSMACDHHHRRRRSASAAAMSQINDGMTCPPD